MQCIDSDSSRHEEEEEEGSVGRCGVWSADKKCRMQVGAEGPEEANNVRQGSTALASISGVYCSLILAWCDSGLLVMREWVAQTGARGV